MRKNFAIQVTSQAAVSCASFSISLLAVALGADALEVGVIGAAYGLAQFASSWTFGRAADVHGRRRIVQLGLLASALATLGHVVARSPWELVASRALFGLAAGSFPAALTSLAFDENRKLGKFQSFGSLGFSLGVLAGGLASLVAPVAIFYVSATLLAIAFAVSLVMSYPADHKAHVPVFPRAVISQNLPAYTAVVVRHAGAMAAWCVFPLYLAHMGASLLWIAVANAVNGVFQFFFMSRMDRGVPSRLVVAGLVGSSLTFALLMIAPNLWWAIAAMPVLAASWAALYMGALRFVLERTAERATATGLLQSTIHLANIAGPLAGGLVARAFGYEAALAMGVAGGLLAIPAFVYELKRHPAPTPGPSSTIDAPLPIVGAAVDKPGVVSARRD